MENPAAAKAMSSMTDFSAKQALLTAVVREQMKDLTPSSHFRMSSIGQCVRAQVGLRAGLPPTNEWAIYTRFKIWTGSVMGPHIQRALEREGFLDPTYTEKEVAYRSYVGHLDGATFGLPCGPTVVEIKTSDDSAIAKHDWPMNYQWQGLTYCLATGFKQLLVFQFGKNQGLSRENIFPLTEEWTAKINEHIDQVDSAWRLYEQTQRLPLCVHNFPWEAKTCPFRQEEASLV